jgi:hypothetical protein
MSALPLKADMLSVSIDRRAPNLKLVRRGVEFVGTTTGLARRSRSRSMASRVGAHFCMAERAKEHCRGKLIIKTSKPALAPVRRGWRAKVAARIARPKLSRLSAMCLAAALKTKDCGLLHMVGNHRKDGCSRFSRPVPSTTRPPILLAQDQLGFVALATWHRNWHRTGRGRG